MQEEERMLTLLLPPLFVTVDAGTTAFGVLPVLVWKQEMPKVLITE
jgi:hypothetical protein